MQCAGVGASSGVPSSFVTMVAGLPLSVAKSAARHRIGNRHAVRRQMAHQVEVERQLRRGEVLEDREHVLAVRRRQKEIAVFDPRLDAAKVDDIAEIVVLQPVFELGSGNGSEYGHA
jgi:RNase H-fold protein (predicted Holliday junction resolvase)